MNYQQVLERSSSTKSKKLNEEERLHFIIAEKHNRILELEQQVQFLTDLFSTRDAQNRAVIKQYESVLTQQGEALAYFRAVGTGQPGEAKVQ